MEILYVNLILRNEAGEEKHTEGCVIVSQNFKQEYRMNFKHT